MVQVSTIEHAAAYRRAVAEVNRCFELSESGEGELALAFALGDRRIAELSGWYGGVHPEVPVRRQRGSSPA